MKLAFVFSEKLPMPAVYGGAVETLGEYLIQQLEELGMQIDVYSPYDAKAEQAAKNRKASFIGIPIDHKAEKRIETANRLFRKMHISEKPSKYLLDVCDLLKNGQYDLVVIENRPQFLKEINKIAPKVALHLHNDSIQERHIQHVNQCAFVLPVSYYIGEHLQQMGVSDQIIHVLYNCLDLQQFSRKNPNLITALRSQIKFDDQDFVFAYSGRITPCKGVIELMHAFASIRQDFSHAKLLILGDINAKTEEDKRYIEQIQKLAKQCQGVYFAGAIAHGQIPSWLYAANLAVIPTTTLVEAFCMVALEAMAMELPVICSNQGALPETVADFAQIVPISVRFEKDFENAMREAIQKPELVALKAKQARERARQFDSQNYAKNFLSIISK